MDYRERFPPGVSEEEKRKGMLWVLENSKEERKFWYEDFADDYLLFRLRVGDSFMFDEIHVAFKNYYNLNKKGDVKGQWLSAMSDSTQKRWLKDGFIGYYGIRSSEKPQNKGSRANSFIRLK